MTDPHITAIALCRLLKGQLTSVDIDYIEAEKHRIDWLELFGLARRGGIGGLLAVHLEQVSMPRAVAMQIAQLSMLTEVANRPLYDEAVALCAGAEKQGLTLIPLKGAGLLLQRVYPLGGRMLTDLDLLTRKEQLPALEALLLSHGYRDETYRDHETRFSHHFKYTKVIGRHRAIVELHWTPHYFMFSDPTCDAAVFPRATRRIIECAELQFLHPDDFLLSMLLHLAVHRYRQQLKWAVDIAEFCRVSVIDGAHLYASAERLGAYVATTYAVSLVDTLFRPTGCLPKPPVQKLTRIDRCRLAALNQLCPARNLIESAAQSHEGHRLSVDILLRDSLAATVQGTLRKALQLGYRRWHGI